MEVKLGIIGYKNHAERLRNILDKKRNCCLKFIYHPTKKIKDVRGTNKISDLLSCDGILIASPNNTHFSYLKKLEKFNGYIFCEKPPAERSGNSSISMSSKSSSAMSRSKPSKPAD